MATIGEFSLPPEAFPLGVVFERFPEATVELERVVPTGDDVRPYFWVENVPSQSILEFFEGCPDIQDAKLIDPLGDRSLFRHRSRREDNDVLTALVESDVTLLSAMGTRNGWQVHVRGDERRALSSFDERCRAAGIAPTLRDLHAAAGRGEQSALAVTDRQREALLLAYQRGYYEDPREADLAELATEVGISRQAFARRLHRGYRTLVESHLRLATD